MKHIEEHMLELYLLGSEKARNRREEIESHLNECDGCRHLAERMGGFYRTADGEFKRLSEQPVRETKALARIEHHLERLYAPEAPAIPLRRPSRLERTGVFIRHHPVIVGVGSFALMALAALTLMTSTQTKDTNPSYVYYNTQQDMFQVHNKEDVKLWEKPSPRLAGEQEYEAEHRIKRTLVTDLEGKGNKVIITTVPFVDGTEGKHSLRIFDGKRNQLLERRFDRQFQYLDRRYDPVFGAGGLLVDDFNGDGKKAILVHAANNRSPMFIARIDSKGNELGTFWHFGELAGIYAVDLDKDGKKEVILCGQNDVSDSNHQEYPVIIVLDPLKIVGESKSVGAPGFHLPFSNAELYYIRLPNSDMNGVLNLPQSVRLLFSVSDSTVHFDVGSGVGHPIPGFEYIFARGMNILQVKSTNETDRLYTQMVKEGKLTGKLDDVYLENLRSEVRYWDGETWVKEPTRVRDQAN